MPGRLQGGLRRGDGAKPQWLRAQTHPSAMYYPPHHLQHEVRLAWRERMSRRTALVARGAPAGALPVCPNGATAYLASFKLGPTGSRARPLRSPQARKGTSRRSARLAGGAPAAASAACASSAARRPGPRPGGGA